MNRIQVNMLVGECWYAMDVAKGLSMPIDKTSSGKINLVDGAFRSQTMPFLVSNHGRYIWCEDGFECVYRRGKMFLSNEPSKHSIDLFDGFGTLKEAFIDASNKYFKPSQTHPNEALFREPLYCTYTTLQDNQTLDGILSYARDIMDKGMRPGVLTIDVGWQDEIGDWNFDLTKIPQPKLLVDELHRMGFKVRLWIGPMVSEKADCFEYLKYSDMLLKDKNNKIAKRHWWKGTDAIIDLSNPDSREWISSKCDSLIEEFGVDGFKFEGGDTLFYRNSDITYNAVDANTESMYLTKIASKYEFNEVRACYKCGGMPIATRLFNKRYGYKDGGLDEIVPCMLMQGIMGYPYGCPDMVGGSYGNTTSKHSKAMSMELIIRYAEACALMPMVQYSWPIWNIENDYVASLFKIVYDIHEKYANYILSLVKNASKTGEPIIRYLEYEFPHQGFHMVNNMFMLGSRYLVAPITEPNKYQFKIKLPKGIWQYVDGKIYEGEVTVDSPLEVLPIFEKIR